MYGAKLFENGLKGYLWGFLLWFRGVYIKIIDLWLNVRDLEGKPKADCDYLLFWYCACQMCS